jgi:hypothetical protein
MFFKRFYFNVVKWYGSVFLPEIQKSEVNNVSNIIIIQKANKASSVGQHRTPRNAKLGSGVAEEETS